MRVIAFNGSPRKNWNTATLLKQALAGAASQGTETELIHLYDYNYKGCISCFACKLKGGPSYGRCAVNDDLKPILEKAEAAGAIILGSPIYFGETTGMFRSFLERLLFQYLVYDAGNSSLSKRRIPAGFIYTMNVDQSRLEEVGYVRKLKGMEMAVQRILGATESLWVTDTYQFDDYAKYETSAFNEAEKARRRREAFPDDHQKALAMGVRLARKSGI